MSLGLLPPWVKWAALAVLATASLSTGFFAGTQWVTSKWNAEKAEAADALAKKTAQAMEDSRRMAVAQRAKDNAYEAQIRSIGGRLADALVSLHDRPERPDVPADPGTCAGSTGASLARPDAEFLTRLSAIAAGQQADLARCIATLEILRAGRQVTP